MSSLWGSRVAFHLFTHNDVAGFVSVAGFAHGVFHRCLHTTVIFHLPKCLDMAWLAYTITLYVCFVSHCQSAEATPRVTCRFPHLFGCAITTVRMVYVHNVPKHAAISMYGRNQL